MSIESLQIMIEAVDNATKSIQGVQRQVEALKKTASNFKSLGEGMTNVGKSMTRNVTLPIVAGLGLATKAAVDFESSMADVNKAFGLKRGTDQAAAMSKQILRMSRDLPYSAEGIADVATSAGKLGVQQNQMESFVKLVAQMGVAFDMSSDQAGDSIAKLANVFGYMDKQGKVNIQGLTGLGNVINHLADTGATSEADLVNSMTRIGGVTRTFGLANDQAAALSAAFLNLGAAPEVVATSIASFLPMLQSATTQSPKFKKGLESIGISAQEMQDSVGRDATGALFKFFGALKSMDKTSRIGAIQRMFGTGSDSRLIAQLAEDTTQLDKAFESLGKVQANGMMQSFEARSATTASQLQKLKNGVTEIGITLGNALLPAINNVVSAVMPMVHAIADFAAAHPQVTTMAVAFLGVAAAIGPVIIVAGQLVTAIGAIARAGALLKTLQLAAAFKDVPSAIGAVTTALRGFAIAATPVAALVGILGGVAYGVIRIGAAMQGTTLTFDDFKNTITTAFAELPANLAQIPATFGAIFSAVGTSIKMAFVNIGLDIQMMVMNAQMALANVATSIQTGFSTALTGVQTVISGMVSAITSGASEAVSAIASMGSEMVSAVASIASQMFEAGANIVNSIADGIRSAAGAVTSAISSIASTVRGALPFSPPEWGPLKDIMSSGGNIVNSIASGISSAPITSAMERAMSPVASAFNVVPNQSLASMFNPGMGPVVPTSGGSPLGSGLVPTARPASPGQSIALTYSPTIHIGASANEASFRQILNDHKDEILKILAAEERNQMRVSYS